VTVQCTAIKPTQQHVFVAKEITQAKPKSKLLYDSKHGQVWLVFIFLELLLSHQFMT